MYCAPYPTKCISCVGNGLDRSANLPTCWGLLPHSVREMSRSDRGRAPPSAGGTRKARDGGAKYIKIRGRARRPTPTSEAPSRRPVSPPSWREVAFAVGKRRRERNGKISPPVKCCAFDSLALSRYPILFTAWSAEQNRPLRPQMFPFSVTGGGHICCPSEGTETAGASPRPTL